MTAWNFANGSGSNTYGLVYDTSDSSFYQGSYSTGTVQHFSSSGNSLGVINTGQSNSYFLALAPSTVPET